MLFAPVRNRRVGHFRESERRPLSSGVTAVNSRREGVKSEHLAVPEPRQLRAGYDAKTRRQPLVDSITRGLGSFALLVEL